MNHPPIPENCEFFKQSYEYWDKTQKCWVFSIWGSSYQPLDLRFASGGFNELSPWKKIIAAVAYKAWKETEEIFEKEVDEYCRDERGYIQECICSDAYIERHGGTFDECLAGLTQARSFRNAAGLNAKAWSDWGNK